MLRSSLMVIKILRVLLFFAFAKALISCNTAANNDVDVSKVQVNSQLFAFHEDFANANSENLTTLKATYPNFFATRVPDSVWIARLSGKDTIQNVLEDAVRKKNFDLKKIEAQVVDVMQHVKYYFPEFKETPIYTIISEVDRKNRIIAGPEELIVSIDTYLGKDHELYQGISAYQREHLNPSQIPADVAMAYAKLFVEPTMDRTFLGSMIYHGKLHYLQTLFAPQAAGATIFEYEPGKYDYMLTNEAEIWRYFVDVDLLYSTDSRLLARFIMPAPFSKFYLEVDQETPGGAARYIGYRIVASYMEYNKQTTLDQLLNLEADVLFNKSKYKPKQ
jgi:gliding motility-associated lipoprotein GldB